MKVVAITGIAGFWGELLAPCLEADEQVARIIAFDQQPPPMELSKLEHVPVRIEDDTFAEILADYDIDVFYHLAFGGSFYYQESRFQKNVMGAMNVIGACAVLGIPRVIFKSSTTIYGARMDTPLFIDESYPIYRKHRLRFNKELYDIEHFLARISYDYPELRFISLRCCYAIGPTVPSPLAWYLRAPQVTTLMGFDPLLQVIHEDDVVRALHHALHHDIRGPVHIAPDKPLPLSKIIRLTRRRRLPVPHPLAYATHNILALAKSSKVLTLENDALRYSLVVDNTKMKQAFGFQLQYTPEEALAAFVNRERILELHRSL